MEPINKLFMQHARGYCETANPRRKTASQKILAVILRKYTDVTESEASNYLDKHGVEFSSMNEFSIIIETMRFEPNLYAADDAASEEANDE